MYVGDISYSPFQLIPVWFWDAATTKTSMLQLYYWNGGLNLPCAVFGTFEKRSEATPSQFMRWFMNHRYIFYLCPIFFYVGNHNISMKTLLRTHKKV